MTRPVTVGVPRTHPADCGCRTCRSDDRRVELMREELARVRRRSRFTIETETK